MYWDWKPYVSVAKRRANAAREAKQLAKKRGRDLKPIAIEGRKIARTFWGEAWCDSLENHSDFANRLPRGRTYVRNGSVIDLDIARGRIDALVSGSELYTVCVEITALKPAHWTQLKGDCSESIDSLLDLLAGRFSDGVMRRLTDPQSGLFPQPKEIKMSCSCPDWAVLCKHVAAVLYGIGARLDREPELLFVLRGVDHTELVSQAVSGGNLASALSGSGDALAGEDLGAMFGIELESGTSSEMPNNRGRRSTSPKPTATTPKRGRKEKTIENSAPVVVIEKPAAKKPKRNGSEKTVEQKARVATTEKPAAMKSRSPKSSMATRAKRAARAAPIAAAPPEVKTPETKAAVKKKRAR